MDILTAIKSDFEAKKGRCITVPEWGDVTIYFDPVTALERAQINKGTGDSEERAIVNLVIQKSLDATGKPVFKSDAETRATLEGKADWDVVLRVAQAITGDVTEVSAAKND